jgi:hypothetical protein
MKELLYDHPPAEAAGPHETVAQARTMAAPGGTEGP